MRNYYDDSMVKALGMGATLAGSERQEPPSWQRMRERERERERERLKEDDADRRALRFSHLNL